jgi:hypothetical protein
MLIGTVGFSAKVKGNGVAFPLFEFTSGEPGIQKVELESSAEGEEIRATVHLLSVPTHEIGIATATNVIAVALNRICFLYGVGIENAYRTHTQLSLMDPPPGLVGLAGVEAVAVIGNLRAVIELPTAQLKSELEQRTIRGERLFGLFRSARRSTSSVEEFMLLYHILLMLFGDDQTQVDAFIFSEDARVPQTQHPLKRPGVTESIYTRLRNELAHRRAGANIDTTKSEMASRVTGLATLVRRAIELHG